jgi:SAM-dependent methyltransferase
MNATGIGAASKDILNALHGRAVFGRRVQVLSRVLAATLPPGAGSVLDLGSGDGSIAAALMALRPELSITGVDVMIRPRTEIPVALYNGHTLPFADSSHDYVTIVDVLHHTDDPAAVLTEAARVARRGVVVKDHLLEGWLAGPTLRFMDWVGNRGHDVVLPYNYLPRAAWDSAFAAAGLAVGGWNGALGLYPAPFSQAFDRTLHFVALLVPAQASRRGEAA